MFPSINDNLVEVTKTYVSDFLRGQGVAGKLMNILYDELRRTDRKAKLVCSYAVSWFNKNIDKQMAPKSERRNQNCHYLQITRHYVENSKDSTQKTIRINKFSQITQR